MTRDDIISASKAEGGMFIVIPSVVQLDTELPLSARMLYGIITWKCNSYAFTWATNRELGETLGVSAKRVSALLSLLETRGHIETEIEYKDGTNEIVRRYIYPVMQSARSLARGTPPPKNKDTPPSEQAYLSPGMGIPPPENEKVICNINNNKKNIKDPPYSPPKGDGAVPDDLAQKSASETQPAPAPKSKREHSCPKHAPEAFDMFWKEYPRKDKRLAAIKAWDKLKPNRELCRVMYSALMRHRNSPQWTKNKGKYIPMFSTWLNEERWKDEGVDISLLPNVCDTGGWAEDPEVMPDG